MVCVCGERDICVCLCDGCMCVSDDMTDCSVVPRVQSASGREEEAQGDTEQIQLQEEGRDEGRAQEAGGAIPGVHEGEGHAREERRVPGIG